jgi:hypothetical protein
MKKLIPYIISYIIIATATAIYPYVYRQFFMPSMVERMPAGSIAIVMNPGMSHEDLVAKLQQVGLSEAHGQPMPTRPSHLPALVHHYVFDAVMLSAFAGLVILFRRIFPSHDHAA